MGDTGAAVPWVLAGLLCLAGATFALTGARGAVPSADVPSSWLPPVVMLVDQLAALLVADHAALLVADHAALLVADHAALAGGSVRRDRAHVAGAAAARARTAARAGIPGGPGPEADASTEAPGSERVPTSAQWAALAASVAAAWSCGPSLMWVATAFGTTMDRALALFLSFVAVDLNAAMMAYLARGRMMRRLQSVLVAAAAIGAAVGPAAVALLDVPAALSCAALSAGGLLAIPLMPDLMVRVPDEYLLEWRRHMTRRWTVRGAIPRESRPLRDTDVSGDLAVMFASVGEGTVLALAFATGGYAALCSVMPEAPSIDRTVGFAAYTVLATLVLLLRPRTAGDPAERVMMRAAAVAFAALALVRVGSAAPWQWLLPWLVAALMAVGVLMAAIMPVLDSPFHSILLSRVGDWTVALGLALALPGAMVAAGAWETIRGLMA